jgi:hypothetical protein
VAGEEKRERQIAAGAGGVVSGFVAVVAKVMNLFFWTCS